MCGVAYLSVPSIKMIELVSYVHETEHDYSCMSCKILV